VPNAVRTKGFSDGMNTPARLLLPEKHLRIMSLRFVRSFWRKATYG
jgi:hypothetical protein